MLPQFIIGGIQKSGTTFLYNLVKNHKQIRMPLRSMDSSFFDDDRIYVRGMSWYESLFDQFKDQENVVVGQVSADCSFNNGSIKRIKENLPNVKLIFVLRHPIERTYSQYWFMYGNGVEYKRINDALNIENERVNKNYYNYKMYSYLGRSQYKKQFDEVFQHFLPENVMLVPFDVLIKDTLNTLNAVFRFLEVEEVGDLQELNFDSIPKNQVRLPDNHNIVLASYWLQKMGLKRIGKVLINKNRKEQRPPKISDHLLNELEQKLKEDIEFYNQIKIQFAQKYAKQ